MSDPERIAALERRVAELEGQVVLLMDLVGVGLKASSSAVDPELLMHLKAGNKVLAIQRHVAMTGAGLRQAKDAVEELAARLKL